MKIFLFILLSLFFINCSHVTCGEGIYVYRDLYRRHLIILEESKHPRKLVIPKEVKEAVTFLEVVSGISSKADKHNNISYRNKSDFNSDIRLWKQWYKRNKCMLTLHYVDSSFNSLGLER